MGPRVWVSICAKIRYEQTGILAPMFLKFLWEHADFFFPQNEHAWRSRNGHTRRAMITPLKEN